MKSKITIEIQVEWKARGEMAVNTRVTDSAGTQEYRTIESLCSYMFAYYRSLKTWLANIKDADVFVVAPYARFRVELKALDPAAGSMSAIVANILKENNIALHVR